MLAALALTCTSSCSCCHSCRWTIGDGYRADCSAGVCLRVGRNKTLRQHLRAGDLSPCSTEPARMRDRHADRQSQAGRQNGRHPDRQADRQTALREVHLSPCAIQAARGSMDKLRYNRHRRTTMLVRRRVRTQDQEGVLQEGGGGGGGYLFRILHVRGAIPDEVGVSISIANSKC